MDSRAKRRHEEDERAPLMLCVCISQGCAGRIVEKTGIYTGSLISIALILRLDSGEKGVYLEIRKYRQHQGKERARLAEERKRVIEHRGEQSQKEALERYEEALAKAILQMNIRNVSTKKEGPPALSQETLKYHQQAKILVANELGQMQDHCADHLRRLDALHVPEVIAPGGTTMAQIEKYLSTSSDAMKFVMNSNLTLAKSRRGPARNTPAVKTSRDQVEAKLEELMARARQIDSLCEDYLQSRERHLQDLQGAGTRIFQSGMYPVYSHREN